MANIPFKDIADLMNRLLDEAAQRRLRAPNYAGPLTPIKGPKREERVRTAPKFRSAA